VEGSYSPASLRSLLPFVVMRVSPVPHQHCNFSARGRRECGSVLQNHAESRCKRPGGMETWSSGGALRTWGRRGIELGSSGGALQACSRGSITPREVDEEDRKQDAALC